MTCNRYLIRQAIFSSAIASFLLSIASLLYRQLNISPIEAPFSFFLFFLLLIPTCLAVKISLYFLKVRNMRFTHYALYILICSISCMVLPTFLDYIDDYFTKSGISGYWSLAAFFLGSIYGAIFCAQYEIYGRTEQEGSVANSEERTS